MKKQLHTLSATLFLLFGSIIASAQTYSIEKWFEGKKSATVITYDDWSPRHKDTAIKYLEIHDLVGTFFVTHLNVNNYNSVQNAANLGHEIANHTIEHLNLTSITPQKLESEVNTAKNIIESNLNDISLETFAYPFGAYNQTTIDKVKENHIAARKFRDGSIPSFPYEFANEEDDYFSVPEIALYEGEIDADSVGYWMNYSVNNNSLMIFTLHKLEGTTWGQSNVTSSAVYNSYLSKISDWNSDIWTTSFAKAIKYHKEAHCATLSTVSTSSNQWILNLTDTLSNNTTYNQALTLRLNTEGETIVEITQNGQNIPFTVEGNEVVFNAVPDAGNITLNKNSNGVLVLLDITNPQNGEEFSSLDAINFAATASATNATIANVTFSINGQTTTDVSAPYSSTFTPLAYGNYTVQATAMTNSGETVSKSVSFTIQEEATCQYDAFVLGQVYTGGDFVSHNGIEYKAKWWTNNSTPPSQVWEQVGMCSNGGITNQVPTVSISTPSNNATFDEGESVTISATASDADGTITKVEFFNGSTKLGEDLTSPYSFSWNGAAVGNYAITAKATDNENAITTSSVVNVTINTVVTNQTPTVSISAPSNNATFDEGESVTISATATDTDGTISKVEFFSGNTKLGEDLTSPYSFTWNGASTGNYAITAKATDNENATTTSSVVNVTINTVVTNQTPTVSISAPSNNATFDEGESVTISATATDADGTVTKVEFFNGNTKLGEDLTSPYSFTWNGASAGNYAITAKATDNENATTTSSVVNITINTVSTGSCSNPTWSSTATYNGGDLVSFQGYEYRAKWWTQANPATTSGPYDAWENLGLCSTPSARPSFTKEEVTVYPNPVNTEFIVEASEEIIKIEVFNMAGQLVSTELKTTEAIDLSNQPSGIYILHITGTRKHSIMNVRKL